MKLFSFDNFWGLNWQKNNSNNYTCYLRDFVYTADTTRAHSPFFRIYKGEVSEATCLMANLDSDSFIMQLKSIKETGKLLVKN